MKNLRDRTHEEEDEDIRPVRRRRRKKRGGSGGALIIGLIGGLLLVTGGVVGAYFLFFNKDEDKSKKTDTNKGSDSGKATDETSAKQLRQLEERLIGNWEGTLHTHPNVQLSMQVIKDQLAWQLTNLKTGKKDGFNFGWKSLRASGNTLVIQHDGSQNGESNDWSIEFQSNDAIQVTSMSSGRLLGSYRRVGR